MPEKQRFKAEASEPPGQDVQVPNPNTFSVGYFIKTLWLFTRSDFKTFVIPKIIFGLFGALSGSAMTTNPEANLVSVAQRVPHVVLWTWINILMFTMSNQRLPDAVMEDKINKAWRPLPAGRINCVQTRWLLLVMIPIGFLVSLYTGAAEETALLTCLSWMYNELGGADHYIARNFVLAFTFAGYLSGAARVACGSDVTINRAAYEYIAIIGGVICTTMHVQDLKDQAGDDVRGRKTAPLVWGESLARWTIAVPVLIWSVVCPAFWSLHTYGFVISVVLGLIVAGRVIWMRGVGVDRFTWKIWSAWLTSLYVLPIFRDPGFLSRALNIA